MGYNSINNEEWYISQPLSRKKEATLDILTSQIFNTFKAYPNDMRAKWRE